MARVVGKMQMHVYQV